MRSVLLPALACLFLLACGYRWQGFDEPAARSVLGDGSSTLRIGVIEEESLYPDLPYYLRSLLRDEINLRKLARWVDSGDADYVMDVRVSSFQIYAYVSDADAASLLNAAAVELELVVRHGTGGSVAWSSGNIVYSEHYEDPREAEVIREVLEQAVNRALDGMQMEF
jgi:hypothetical protein